jgi:hypothetical protein
MAERALQINLYGSRKMVSGPPAVAIFSHSTGEPLNTVDLHVLARAYRTAWRSLFARDPVGSHVIAALDVLFVFWTDGLDGDE